MSRRTTGLIHTAVGFLFAWCLISSGALAAEMTTVRIGLTPVLDYQPWLIAHDMGMDHELGVNIEPINVTSTGNGISALRQGSLDLAVSAQVSAFSFYKMVPALRTWIVLNQFKGFIIVGREGQTETYQSLVGKLAPEKAKEQILLSMKGKKFAIDPANYRSLIKAALDQVGLTLDDVQLIEFADSAKAGLAFESGVADYFIGNLPTEAKLLSQPDRYVSVGGHEILGPAGLWYSSMVALDPWLTSNHDTVMKLIAIWYRVSRYIAERNDQIMPEWQRIINERASAAFSMDDMRRITGLMWYPSIKQSEETVFNPGSDLYWRKSMDYYVPQNKDKLPADFGGDKYNYEEVNFHALLKDTALLQWINAPLK
jgi:ABC-type nitrate/sulfonate/bicarbonate transport system substrate-binding protein